MRAKPKVVSIVGPTSSGKTSLSIAIAKHCNGEVISADSRQVYRGLDIGSGKVTAIEMDGVPHHLLDVNDPMTIYTGTDFKRDATVALENILKRDCLPIVAGGTFFYVELLRGSMQAAPVAPNHEFRESLASLSDAELLEQLKARDKKRAETIDPHNRRRLVRALEIINALGSVPTVTQTPTPYEWLTIGIDKPQEQLHQDIHDRLYQRVELGLISEVEALLENGVTYARLDELGLEYRYVSKYLQGELTKIEMLETLETRIKQFAKRQLTWLKRDETIEWFSAGGEKEVLNRVQQFVQS